MNVGLNAASKWNSKSSNRTEIVSRLVLTLLLGSLCAGCSGKPDAAPVPPGPPMPAAQAQQAREQYIDNDSRMTPAEKQAAIQRLNGNSGQ